MLALAAQVELESVDPMQDFEEMVTLCHKLLRSGVKESHLYITMQGLANATHMTTPLFVQPFPDAIECLHEAR